MMLSSSKFCGTRSIVPHRRALRARAPVFVRRVGPDGLDALNALSLVDSVASHPSVHVLAKAVTSFALIYCTLNWFHYRNVRKEIEDDENQKK